MLFKPDLIGEECEGIHEVLMYSIQKSDMDLRKMLYQNIVLSGGSTLFKGFGDRLLQEIKKNVAKDMKIRVSSMISLASMNDLKFFVFSYRLLHLKSDCTQHGWVARFSRLSIHSRRCGYRSESSTRKASVQYIERHFRQLLNSIENNFLHNNQESKLTNAQRFKKDMKKRYG